MKRQLMSVLVGASLFLPAGADAQRARAHRANQPTPMNASGRLAVCRTPAQARPFDCRARVVYSSRARTVVRPDGRLWIRASWGHLRLGTFGHRGRDRFLNQSDLRDILGLRTVHMVRDEGRRAGLRGALRGHWIEGGAHGRVLVVTMDRVDVAEFVDIDRDGLIDEVFIVRPGRDRRVVGRW